MLKDDRARGLATEFAGNWLDFRHFEDTTRWIASASRASPTSCARRCSRSRSGSSATCIRNDRSVLDMLYGNYTFVNPVLAKHYGMPEVTGGPDHWVRVDNARELRARRPAAHGRVPDAELAGPAHQPGEARLLGGAARAGRGHSAAAASGPGTAEGRGEAGSAVARHAGAAPQNPACAACHARFDTFGLAFGGYGPVGEARTKDLAGHAVDTQATFPGGSQGTGIAGPRRPTSGPTARRISWTTSAARCWSTRSAARCSFPTSRWFSGWRRRLAASGYRIQCAGRDDRDQPAVPEQTHHRIRHAER